MRNKKLGAQVPGAGQVHGGQDEKWGQLHFGRGGADLARDAVRDGVERCLLTAVLGAELVQGW